MPEHASFLPDGAIQRTKNPPRLKVVHANDAYSLIALESVTAGRLLFVIEGDLTDRASRYSVQVGRNSHIDLLHPPAFEILSSRYPWRFMNHSCEPTARIAGRVVIALRDIAPGGHVTFDYNTTEWEIAEPFTCHCGASRCLGEIRGFKFLSTEQRDQLGDSTADYLLGR